MVWFIENWLMARHHHCCGGAIFCIIFFVSRRNAIVKIVLGKHFTLGKKDKVLTLVEKQNI